MHSYSWAMPGQGQHMNGNDEVAWANSFAAQMFPRAPFPSSLLCVCSMTLWATLNVCLSTPACSPMLESTCANAVQGRELKEVDTARGHMLAGRISAKMASQGLLRLRVPRSVLVDHFMIVAQFIPPSGA